MQQRFPAVLRILLLIMNRTEVGYEAFTAPQPQCCCWYVLTEVLMLPAESMGEKQGVGETAVCQRWAGFSGGKEQDVGLGSSFQLSGMSFSPSKLITE